MKNFLEHFLPLLSSTQQNSQTGGFQTVSPIVMSAKDMFVYNANGKIELPLGNDILDADFSRLGRDLMVGIEGQRSYLVTNYFALDTLPALVSDTGKHIRPETVKLLAGNPADGQYAGPVEGTSSIGMVEKLAGDVYVIRGGEEVQLEAGDPVYQDDIIRTESDGSVGITFIDGSVFSLGTDARMTLDSLVYDPATGEGSSEVTVLKGMFKFVSGDIAANNPGDMVVETPVATIGIRGTTGGGNVQGPGMENQFFLEPNADGTVGWFDVTTEGGTVSMNQPFMQVSLDSINSAPPAPIFTTPEALQQQFSPINEVLPEGRYDDRPDDAQAQPDAAPVPQEAGTEEGVPESSELLDAQSNEPQAPQDEQQAENMDAGETTDEGTTSEELLEVASEQGEVSQSDADNFDGQQNEQFIDPTQDPMAEFIRTGDVVDTLQNTAPSGETSQLPPPPPPAPVIQAQPAGTTATTSGTDSYFQNIQDQINVGNLPPNTLNPTPPPPPPPPGGSLPPPPDNGTVAPPPVGTISPNMTVKALNDSVVETLRGGSGNDTFMVDMWSRYSNPNASYVADRLQGGTGYDKLGLLSHTSIFNTAAFNAANTGIDAIVFGDAAVTSVSMTINNAMIDQSDNNLLTIMGGDKDLTLDVSGITDDSMKLHLQGSGDFATLVGGTQAEITLGTTAMNIVNDGSGELNLNVLSGSNTIGLSGAFAHTVRLAGGNNTVSTGSGDDKITLTGGTQSVQAGAGSNDFHMTGGINHTLTGGAGTDDFIIRGGSATINGGAGSNYYNLSGNATVDITNSYGTAGNTYDIHHFAGTADITVFSDTSGYSDKLFISTLNAGSALNLTLDDANGTTANVALNFGGSGYGDNAYQQSGNDLVIATQAGSGGDIVLKDFFSGNKAYTLEYQARTALAELISFEFGDSRNLNSSYTFTGVGLQANSLSVTDGSDLVTVTMVNHGFQTGDTITLAGFSGGENFEDIVSGDVNGTWVVTVVDGDTFTYTMSHIHAPFTPGTTTFGSAVQASFGSVMYDTIADFANQTIAGDLGQVYIAGKGGNDTITGGDDAVATQIHGGDGNDRITGYSNDVLKGGKGKDVLLKADGAINVTFYGGDTTDTQFDMVDYSNQSSFVHVNLGTTPQTGNAGSSNYNDYLSGIEGVRGTAYNDVLIGATGASRHNYFDGGAGNDTITGGTGTLNINTVDYAWITSALTVTLDNSGAATISHAQAGMDVLAGIQNIVGGSGNDSITGGSQNNAFYGEAGMDTLIGGLGSDTLFGGTGNDTLMLGNGTTDAIRDVAGFGQSANGTDTIHHFRADTNITTQATAEMQDGLDISDILHNMNLQGMNYFDLIKKGFLVAAQNGADTLIKIDTNGASSGGITTIANLLNTTADSLDWKHFITSDSGKYMVNNTGSTGDDIIVATGTASINANAGHDIIDIRSSASFGYNGGQGDDIFVVGDASILGNGNTLDGGLDKDTLVIDFDSPDFSAYTMSSATNFEVLDLYGNTATMLQGAHVLDMSGDNKFLFVESSKAGASISLDSASFTLANPSDVHLPPMADAPASQYTTYVADVSGTEVYVHVNNNVTTSLT